MILESAVMTNVGRVRSNNEDNFCQNGTILPQEHTNCAVNTVRIATGTRPFLGIFDGMGGYEKGEFSSWAAAERAAALMKEPLTSEEMLRRVCDEANTAICEEMRKTGQRTGSTAAMLKFEAEKAILCNVGDSPIYLLRGGRMVRISEEHTERSVYEQVTGHPAPAGKKFRLTQNLGIFPEEMTISPYLCEVKLLPDDLFLLCSDGLTDMVEESVIETVLKGEKDLPAKVQDLVQMALEAGGKDNITVMLAKISPEKKHVPVVVPALIAVAAGLILGGTAAALVRHFAQRPNAGLPAATVTETAADFEENTDNSEEKQEKPEAASKPFLKEDDGKPGKNGKGK